MPDHYHESISGCDEKPWKTIDDDLEAEKSRRIEHLSQQIEEVKQELERRETIHEENERDLQHQIEYQKELVEKTSASLEPDAEMRDRIQELHVDVREERRKAFQDVKSLNAELRELQKQRDKLNSSLK